MQCNIAMPVKVGRCSLPRAHLQRRSMPPPPRQGMGPASPCGAGTQLWLFQLIGCLLPRLLCSSWAEPGRVSGLKRPTHCAIGTCFRCRSARQKTKAKRARRALVYLVLSAVCF